MSREGVSTWVSELEGTTQITMHNLEHYIIHVIGVLRGGGQGGLIDLINIDKYYKICTFL